MSILKEKLKTPVGILEAALAHEKEAYSFYSDLLSFQKVNSLRRLVEQLKDEEYKHMRLLEDKLVKFRLG